MKVEDVEERGALEKMAEGIYMRLMEEKERRLVQ